MEGKTGKTLWWNQLGEFFLEKEIVLTAVDKSVGIARPIAIKTVVGERSVSKNVFTCFFDLGL